MDPYKNSLIKKFSYLPFDLINLILGYSNIIVYRNGKYINRIDKKDKRYNLLIKIPRPIKISNNQYYLGLAEKGRQVIKLSITYIIEQKNVRIITLENYIGRNGLIYSQRNNQDVIL
jgi:hypothetical protein